MRKVFEVGFFLHSIKFVLPSCTVCGEHGSILLNNRQQPNAKVICIPIDELEREIL